MSMFTGLRPDQTKVWDLATYLLDACPGAVTMQQHFREAGYETAGSGKVMHGASDEHPLSWSIPFVSKKDLPYAEGFPVPAHDNQFYQNDYSHMIYNQMEAEGITDWRERRDYMINNNALPSTEALDVPDEAYVDGALARWSIDMLTQFSQSDKPFFLTVGFTKPHLPFVAPKQYWDMYDRQTLDLAPFRQRGEGAPQFAHHQFDELRSYTDVIDTYNTALSEDQQRELIHGYYACVSYIDAQIGKILDSLETLGLAENTIIVLWGDHGYHLGDHGMWTKQSNFEEATRSPLIIAAPGYTGGQNSPSSTEFVDIFPTLCELADLDPPYEFPGDSLVPVMENPQTSVKDFAVSQYPRLGTLMGYALRDDRYRIVMWMNDNWRSTMPFNESNIEAIELYDYQTDPLESVNLATLPEYQSVLANQQEKLVNFFKSQEGLKQPEKKLQPGTPPDANGHFIELNQATAEATQTRFASARVDGSDLLFDFELSTRWPSVDLVAAPDPSWDLSACIGVEIQLVNESTLSVPSTAFIANEGDSSTNTRRSGVSQRLQPGVPTTVRILFSDAVGDFDPDHLSHLRVSVGSSQQPITLRVTDIRAIMGLDSWLEDQGITTPNLTGDVDLDGYPLLLEYFLDGQPDTADSDAHDMQANLSDTKRLGISLKSKRATFPTDLTIALEGSNDLGGNDPWVTIPATHYRIDNGGGIWTHRWEQNTSLDNGGKAFIRLSVTGSQN